MFVCDGRYLVKIHTTDSSFCHHAIIIMNVSCDRFGSRIELHRIKAKGETTYATHV